MQDKLLEQIETISHRYRKLRTLRWSAAVIAIGVLLTTLVAVASVRGWLTNVAIEPIQLVAAIVASTFIGLVIVRIVAYRSFRTPKLIAKEVERAFPDLGQKLLTAVEQSQSGLPLGFLQQRVIEQAYQHAKNHPWRNTVAENKLRVGRFANSALGLTLAGLVAFLILKPVPPTPSFASSLPMTNPDILIEPGSIELERGSSLVVTADWGQTENSRLPALDPELLASGPDGSESRVPMRRNLADPVWAVAMTDVQESFDYRVESTSGTSTFQSQVYRIDVFEYPEVTRTDAALEFPSYTRQDPTTVNDTVRVAVVEGTNVTWHCTVNQPLESAVMLDQEGTNIPMTQDDQNPLVWSAETTMNQSNLLTVHLVDMAGRENQYPTELSCKVLANRPPKFELTEAGDAIVSPLEEFPVAANVTDDFGVIRSGVRFTFDNKPDRELSLGQSSSDPPKRKTKLTHLFDFEKFDAVADQLLAYSFWAEDIGPDGQIRRVDSDLFFAEVRPFEEIYRQGQQPPSSGQPSERAQKAEELLELQKQIIQATWNQVRKLASQTSQKSLEGINVIAESQNDAIAQLDELKAKVRDPESIEHVDAALKSMNEGVQALESVATGMEPDAIDDSLRKALAAERSAYANLLKLRAREFEVSKSQSQPSSSSRSGSQNRKQQLDELELDEDENRYETQATAEQSAQQNEQRETRQILSRLRELAQRQQDLNKEIAQLQSALQLAQTEEEKQEVERLLKRLREQQEEILRQADETQERMQEAESSESMRQASEQLQETRENLRQAGEAMEQHDAATALSQGKRAERELKELRDDVRTQAADQFQDTMRQMRADAADLAEQQKAITEQMQPSPAPDKTPGLRADQSRDETAENLKAQRQRLENLLEQMQETVSQSESAEPLLAEKLYESFRETQQRQTTQRIDQAEQLWKRGFDVQANEMNDSATEAIEELKSQIDSAAENILASETESLQQAIRQLESLQESLDAELAQQTAEADQRQRPTSSAENPKREASQASSQSAPLSSEAPPGASSSEAKADQSKPENRKPEAPNPDGQPTGSQPTDQEQGSGQQPGGQQPGGQPTDSQPSGDVQNNQPSQQRSGSAAANPQSARGGAIAGGPLAGDGFRDFSDGLRDVEEMVQDPELRSRAAQIRQRAREVRAEFQRNSKTPQWDLVEEMIAAPLRELRKDVSEEWMRRSGDRETLVPIDRDPVPEAYSDNVRQYYENLSSQD